MGRRKKQEQLPLEEEIKPIIHGDVKRSVVAIFLFALAILFVLSFLAEAKIVGSGSLLNLLNLIAGWMFGWGKYISPIVLIIASVILLFRKETLFYVSKLIGISVAFIGILGLIHILAYESDKMLTIARQGEGGGFFGYVFALILLNLTGKAGGAVILIALVLIGLIVAFNFSIVRFANKFIRRKIHENESLEEEEEEEFEVIDEELEDPIVEHKKESKEVKETEFVQDPNKEENESLLKKAAAFVKKTKIKKPVVQDFQDWEYPTIDLLERETGKAQGGDVKKNGKIIRDTFKHFGIDVEPGEILTGPTVTQYSFRPAVGVKLTRITSLSNDLALSLAAHPIRIEAPIPGKSMIGIEVPNKSVAMVRMPELLESEQFETRQSNLLLALGKDVSGNLIFGDLKKMPHLLIAGSTNSGKSVCVNTILLSMLYQNSPEDLKLILVDPKRVELSLYNGIPHLLSDVIVENGKVLSALKWAIGEMERRYKMLQNVGSRDISSFNQKAADGETYRKINHDTNEVTDEPVEKLPYIVIVIDELADLMASHGKEVEGAIIRLAQMARAVGIHLIVSTQRPSVEVITGLIKANIPTRIAFKVATQIDSRTILDCGGAEKLLGNGDMLFSSVAVSGIKRLQGIYASEKEVKKVVDFIANQKHEKNEESLEDEMIVEPELKVSGNGEVSVTYSEDRIDFGDASSSGDQDDALYEEAKKIVIQARKASSSLLQRRLRVGYSRGARLIDMLEENGVIGPADGAKPREVFISGDSGPSYDDDTLDQSKRDKWQM